MADKNALTCSPHTMLLVVFFKSLEARENRRILLWLSILSTKCVVAEGVEADCLGLVRIEIFGEDRATDEMD